jgi:hypothetical protein
MFYNIFNCDITNYDRYYYRKARIYYAPEHVSGAGAG